MKIPFLSDILGNQTVSTTTKLVTPVTEPTVSQPVTDTDSSDETSIGSGEPAEIESSGSEPQVNEAKVREDVYPNFVFFFCLRLESESFER